jgi:simple sugar transport system ATP-binding protein
VTSPLLCLDGIAKRFDDVVALSDVTLRVEPGTLHALLGENGAGKTTLMRVAYGLIRPDHGSIIVDGIRCCFRSPADALDAGIGMVQQHFSLVPAMTVAENIALGMHRPYRPAALRRDVIALATSTGLAINPDARVADLSVGAQQRVEILKALARSVRILILDEPTAVLPPKESSELLRWIRAFCVGGRAAVLITHKLEEAWAIADNITVLRNGRVAKYSKAADTSSAQLVHAMLGEGIQMGETIPASAATETVVVHADAIFIRDERGVECVRNASFDICAGEIVGVAGVEGAGHLELLRALAGRLTPTSGFLRLPDKIGYAPEDRSRDAVIPGYDLLENLALHGAGSRPGLLHWGQIEQLVLALLRAFDIRAPHARVPIATLSGGNQQKFVFAREMQDRPELLIAINPTRGLDVRASLSLMTRLRAARDDGMAVIIYSSDVDELMALSNRILVSHAGVVTEVPRDRAAIGRAMVGAV